MECMFREENLVTVSPCGFPLNCFGTSSPQVVAGDLWTLALLYDTWCFSTLVELSPLGKRLVYMATFRWERVRNRRFQNQNRRTSGLLYILKPKGAAHHVPSLWFVSPKRPVLTGRVGESERISE